MQNYNKKSLFSCIFIIICSLFFLTSCEKAYLQNGNGEDTRKEVEDGKKVKITVTQAEGQENIKQLFTRISYCIFTEEGQLHMVKHQNITDNDFGSQTLAIANGNYHLVVIAHNGIGNISIESEDKIKFKDNKITDTFAYSTNIDVEKDCSYNIELERIVANVHIVIPDAMPQDVKQMEFYYTGGSSTYSSLSGYGSVNSRQTEYRDITTDMTGHSTEFDIYTIPHEISSDLKLTIKALGEDNSVIKTIQHTDIQISRNTKTIITSSIFEDGSSDDDESTKHTDICITINNSEITDIPKCF